MKVLHLYKTYFPDAFGGVPEVIRLLARGTNKHGVHAEVFSINPNGNGQKFFFENHFVTKAKSSFEVLSTPFSFEAIWKFRRFSKTFDLIHYHYPYPFGDVLKLLGANSTPSIVTFHSDIVKQSISKFAYAPVQKLFLNSVDRIVCTSPNYLNSSKLLMKYRNKVDVVPLGLEPIEKKISLSSEMKSYKKGLPDNYFLFLGVLRNYKSVDTLIYAAKDIDQNIVIAGGGPELNKLKKLAHKLGADNCIFLGPVSQSEKELLLDGCSGLILPSHLRSEAFGLVLLEAAMRSRPLISTELGTGTSYVNKHGKTGLVIPPKDVKALKDAIKFLANNPDKACQMGQYACKHFNQFFTAEKMCSQYATIYCDILKKRGLGSQLA